MHESNRPAFRLDHVGLVVADLASAVAFYSEVFGLEVVLTETDTDVDSEAIGVPGEHVRLRGATLSGGGANIEIHEYLNPTGRNTREVYDPGFGHIAFDVGDIDSAFRYLQGVGVSFNTAPNTIPDGNLAGRRWVYGQDPWGNVIELGQNPTKEYSTT